MHKVKNDTLPSALTNMFETDDRYDLRINNKNYELGKPKTSFMKKALLTQLRRAASTNLNVFLAAPDSISLL